LNIYIDKKQGKPYRAIAKEYGVSLGRVQQIVDKGDKRVKEDMIYGQSILLKLKKVAREEKYARNKK
jgi:transposase